LHGALNPKNEGLMNAIARDFPATWGHPGEWKWFALKVAPGKEFVAERVLRDDGFDVFVPLKHFGKQRLMFARPRLPGYVFIGANGGVIPWKDVRRFRMIIGIVTFDGQPMAFPSEDMHWLLRRHERPTFVKNKTLGRRQREQLSKPMRIASGPYQDHIVQTFPVDKEVQLCAFFDQHLAKH
jgi:transcription antitermination factor NusG